eukprot:SAG11_NODE_19923_length_456_cov_0.949580_1_plen_84_part_00
MKEHYELLKDSKVAVPPQQLATYQSLQIESIFADRISNMRGVLDLTESRKQEDITEFDVMVEANIKMLQEDRVARKNALDRIS